MNEALIKEMSQSGCHFENIQPDDPEYEENQTDYTAMTEEFMYVL